MAGGMASFLALAWLRLGIGAGSGVFQFAHFILGTDPAIFITAAHLILTYTLPQMIFNRICALTGVVAMLLPAPGLSAELSGRVVHIADGDTITILDSTKTQHRIRLLGIDAPEQKQDFGSASKRELAGLLAGKEVRVYFKKYDRYGRILGKVMLNKTDTGLNQIKAGMAWHYKFFKKDQDPKDREYYSKAEVEARTKKRGLWSQAHPLEPWDFRKLSRNNLFEKNKSNQAPEIKSSVGVQQH